MERVLPPISPDVLRRLSPSQPRRLVCSRLLLRPGARSASPAPCNWSSAQAAHPHAPLVTLWMLGTLIQREHAAVAVGIHLDGQVDRGAGLQFPEEVHHAGVAREDL